MYFSMKKGSGGLEGVGTINAHPFPLFLSFFLDVIASLDWGYESQYDLGLVPSITIKCHFSIRLLDLIFCLYLEIKIKIRLQLSFGLNSDGAFVFALKLINLTII